MGSRASIAVTQTAPKGLGLWRVTVPSVWRRTEEADHSLRARGVDGDDASAAFQVSSPVMERAVRVFGPHY